MNKLITTCLMIISYSVFAEDLPPNLIKVTKENNPKCVEFVVYKNEMYCSTEALDKNPASPQVITYETQNIHFDNRPWKAAWGEKKEQITTVEYITVGDDINNWKELITSQLIPNKKITPLQYVNFIKENLGTSVTDFKFNIIEKKPSYMICEFQVKSPSNLIQDEIFKVSQGKDGLYILHYVIKKADMGDAERKKWVELLSKSSVKD